jgi:hypothetical protein
MKLKYLSIIVLSMFLMGNTQCVEKYSFLDVHNKEVECSKQSKTFKLVYNKENIPVNYTCK